MTNRDYLNKIRASSCYPSFRVFIAAFAAVGYLSAIIFGFAGFFSRSGYGMFYLVGAVMIALLVKVTFEASVMIADIADATVDSSSRNAS